MPDVITMLRAAIDEEPPLGFDAAHVLARAKRARRRRAGIAGLGVAGALALSLSVVLPGVATARGTATIEPAAFTLVEHANGTATLTMNPGVLLKPGALRRDLRRDGIPAQVTVARFCTSRPSPAGFSRIVTGQRSAPDTMTIHPAAMPPGTELSFGYFRLTAGRETGQETVETLINTGSYGCDKTVPIGWPGQGHRVLVHGDIVAGITSR